MFTEQFYELLLGFGEEWRVKEVVSHAEKDEVEIYVEYVGENEVYDYAPMRRWRHLDTMQFKTYINSRLPRLKMVEGKVKTLSPPWADRHERHSYLFASAVICVLLVSQNQTQTAHLMGCKFDVVNRILHNATQRGLARRKLEEEVFEAISIDEKSFQKGHTYATVVSDAQRGRVLEVEPERTKEACGKLLERTFTVAQREQIKHISMDMWQAFITTAAEKLPQAEVVHDKFHLIKYLNEAIDKVRKREVKEHDELKNSRYAMLKNEENLTEKQRRKFEEIRQANLEVSRAWEVRENFKAVFKNASLEASAAIFAEWHEAVKATEIKRCSDE